MEIENIETTIEIKRFPTLLLLTMIPSCCKNIVNGIVNNHSSYLIEESVNFDKFIGKINYQDTFK